MALVSRTGFGMTHDFLFRLSVQSRAPHFAWQELWNGGTCLFVDRAAIQYMGYTLRVPGYVCT